MAALLYSSFHASLFHTTLAAIAAASSPAAPPLGGGEAAPAATVVVLVSVATGITHPPTADFSNQKTSRRAGA